VGAIKNKTELSGRHEVLRRKHNMTEEGFREMLKVLHDLTPAERATLADPDFVTEDEDDLIVNDRRMKEPGKLISAEELFASAGYTPRSPRRA
jgi:hypothetical protein